MDSLWSTNLGHGVGSFAAFILGIIAHTLIVGSRKVCSIEFDRKDIKMNKMVATTTDSAYYTYDLRTFNPESGFTSLRHNVSFIGVRSCALPRRRSIWTDRPLLSHLIQFGGESVTVWAVRHLPQNRDLFLTSCGDGTLQLYK